MSESSGPKSPRTAEEVFARYVPVRDLVPHELHPPSGPRERANSGNANGSAGEYQTDYVRHD